MSTDELPTRARTSSIDTATTFHVLGPLEVRVGGTRVEFGGRQERALLALLLTAPGRVLSVADLVAGLWGEHPPGGADSTVMSYVSRLRRGLPDTVAGTVVTRRPGYLVSVAPDQVDAERFRHLLRRGRQELDGGRPELAAASLRDALALWRGDAYAEFDAPFAVTERRSLHELRLAAFEDRASVELDIGGGQDLIAELDALVGAHPLRERLWAQLMRALYRAGRQGDALRSYQRARSALVEELGVEPGDELQSLQAMVLAHDPRLLGPAVRSAGAGRGATVGPAFVGRDRELQLLVEAYGRAMAGSPERVLVTGPHGMGKTRLLAELARQVEASGGTVVEQPALIPAAPTGDPVLLVLDRLEGSTAADLVELSDVLTSGVRPSLVAAACVWEELTPGQVSALGELFPDRLRLAPLGEAGTIELVELYVPVDALAPALVSNEVVAAAGVPLHLHAAASRYGERLLTERIETSAAAMPDPRRRLARSRAEIADDVAELARLRSLRQASSGSDTGRRLCPFKGLAFYDVDDAPYFAGRERLVARLLARLVDAPLLAVVGASGSGKSSVVRAGLVAAVRQGLLPGSEQWHVVVTTPARHTPDLPLPDGPHPTPRTLLVVDQLEEVLTVLPADEQAGYAEWVTAAAGRPDVTVVVAVRSDYFARVVVVHRRLAELLAADTVLVGAMSVDELQRAVEVPAAAADLALEPGLARTIADDVVGEPGGLPLMSTALLSLWEHGDGRTLSVAGYRETGGVRTAVARLAEAAYAPLPAAQQTHARRILLRLAEVDDAGEPVRRRVALAELSVDGDPDARAALDRLATRRLLALSATHAEVSHEALLREWPRLRDWLDEDEAGRRVRRHLVPAAAAWQGSGRDPGELYRGQRLVAALEFMSDHGDDMTELEKEFLRAGQDEVDADAAARRRSHNRLQGLVIGLTVALVLALGAGWVAVDRRQESARLAVASDVRALRAAALGEEGWDLALLYAAQAYRIDGSAQSRAALLRTVHRDPVTTAMYTTDRRLLSMAVSDDGRTMAGLGSAGTVYVWDLETGTRTSTVPGLTQFEVTSLDLSPDGRHVAVVGVPVGAQPNNVGKHLMLLDLAGTPTPTVQTLAGPGFSDARFTADGSTLLTVGIDGVLRQVDVLTGASTVLGVEAVSDSDSNTLDVSPGRRFVVASARAQGQVVTGWEVDSGRVVWSSDEGGGAVASINPAGTAMVLAHQTHEVDQRTGLVEHVDLVSGLRSRVPTDPAAGLVDLDWAPDGSTFAGATTEGTVAVWDARTLELRSILRGHSGTVSQVVHSADGSTLYASGLDGAVVVWDLSGTRGVVRDVADPAPAEPFGPFSAPNRVVSADGSVAVSYLDQGAVEVVDVRAGDSWTVPVEVSGSPAHIFVDPTGRYAGLLTVQWPQSRGGQIQVVDVKSRRLLPNPIQLTADFTSAAPAFTGDGQSIVTGDTRTVLVHDARTGRPAPGRPGYTTRGEVVSLAADTSGRLVAVGVAGGGVEVGDTTTGELVTELVPPGGENLAVDPLSFSPDSRWLAGGSESGGVVVWDTETWDVERTWPAVQGGGVDSLAFTPDSRGVVAGGAGTASVWEVDPRAAAGLSLALSAPLSRSHVAVATRDEGRTVVTLTNEAGVQLWETSATALLQHACAVVGRDMTRAEWAAVLPALPYAHTCGGGD